MTMIGKIHRSSPPPLNPAPGEGRFIDVTDGGVRGNWAVFFFYPMILPSFAQPVPRSGRDGMTRFTQGMGVGCIPCPPAYFNLRHGTKPERSASASRCRAIKTTIFE
jgi:hypothetical protein